jgi:hypothetical protein
MREPPREPVFGPEVAMSTMASAPDGAFVIVGVGFEPLQAMRDLRKLSQIQAKELRRKLGREPGNDTWSVVGISLTPGPVPDHESGEKGATRPGWLALGTLVRRPSAEQQGQARSPAA